MIADEFTVVKSSRKLAAKHELPIHVIQDIVLLCERRQPQSERLSVVDAFKRRMA